MDYISDIGFKAKNKQQLNFYGLNSDTVTIDVNGGQEVVFPIADFIDILKLLSEITERI
jgi:hypothetical protein